MTLLLLTGWHFWRIRKDGGLAVVEVHRSASPQVHDSATPRVYDSKNPQVGESEERLYSWPLVMWIELATLLFVVVVLMMMALLFDAPLREQANAAFPENPAKSPWYFLGIQEMVSYSAFAGGFLIPVLFIIFLISIPYIDREKKYTGIWFSGSQGMRIFGLSVLFSFLITGLLIFVVIQFGWIKNWFEDVPAVIIMFVNPATISSLFYIAWSVFISRKTKSARMAAIALFTCAMTGFIIYTSMGIWFRGPNWEFYGSFSQWPTM
jgi:hypothetical protein